MLLQLAHVRQWWHQCETLCWLTWWWWLTVPCVAQSLLTQQQHLHSRDDGFHLHLHSLRSCVSQLYVQDRYCWSALLHHCTLNCTHHRIASIHSHFLIALHLSVHTHVWRTMQNRFPSQWMWWCVCDVRSQVDIHATWLGLASYAGVDSVWL